jgi:hypothetical protein
MIDKIEIVKRSRVRRAKLYFIRDKVTREVRRQLRRTRLMKPEETTDVVEEPVVEEPKEPKEPKEPEVVAATE